ncbi:hypothetical protein ABVT39_004386 [Epinephelus coioides]
MTCRSHACGPLESCRVEEGERGCRPNNYGTCWIRGPGSYQTFDGLIYHYPGACQLTLAKVMGLSSHPHFMVTAEKVPRGQQGFARVLKFEAEGTQISIEMTDSSKVQVDGQRIRLPFSSASNRIQIYHSSVHSIILRTSFGVTVQTVWPHFVLVTAPVTYSGSLGGLCGNYNANPHDDFRTPNGILVNNSQDFGDSWRDGSLTAHCVENVNQNSTTNYNTSGYCGIIGSPHGPFAQCWAKVDPRQHVDACVEIMRASKDPASTLCEVLRDYALMCQQQGVALEHWRDATDCEQNCPSNSHYEVCGTSCPSTCPSLSFPFTCDTACQEGCHCNDDFVLNGNQCVPPTHCGCYHQGRYWQGGEQFWDGEECQSLCTCDGTTGAVHCIPNSCGPQESCRVVDGELGCHPNPHGSCSASGDPHYLTFDGKAYDFQGTCRYTLVTLCNATDERYQFSVEAKNEPWRGLPVSITAEVFVNVWGYQVHMSTERSGVVQVNGETRTLPIVLNGGQMSIYSSGPRVFVSADFGLSVTYDGYSTVFISVPANYSGKTCGLCGNFNGNPNDEFHTPSGTTVTTPDEFGKAWKVEGDYTCSDGCGSSCPQCTNDLPARAKCEVIQKADGPLSFCHGHVDPAPYFNDCVFDVCVSGNEGQDLLCRAIEAYVSACQSANVRIYPWRQNTTCTLECPANSHYDLCGTDCGHTCASSTDATCEQVCSEGCFCDEGFLRSGTRCVPVESCGCQDDGFYYDAGESFWTEGCSQRCKCHAPNDLRCSAASCTSSQECTIQNGQLGCFDDMTTCTVWGDPHYITFDHKTFDFQGTCHYVLATLCGDTAGLHGFSVEAKNEPWKGLTVSVTAEVFVNVWGYQVHMSRGSHGVVQVNGETKNLPVVLNGTRISIYARGSHTYLSADFGLTVKYDGLYEVSISVPSTYRGKTCGLCGNFNGNPNDEFHTPSGTIVTTPDEFGKAWKVEGDYTCSDGCGSSCPQCTNDLPARAQCEVIQAADGPFSICHKYVDPAPYFKSCVFDVCVAGPDALCADIETYVSACQSANVQISSWRQNTTCRLDCPANSHYELCGTDCGHTCASTNDATCEQGCSEGCFCDEGFLRSGTRCVPEGSCGCQYDGFYYNAGESFWTEGCSRHCECHAPNDLRCSAASCTSSQECTIQNGQLGCFDDMTTCTVWGDPHYITFDHKTYDFQGTCRYVLATLCGDTAGLHGFSVEAKNEPWKGLTVSVTAEVFVNVWGYQVHMSRGSHGVVQVNGETKNLPVVLNGTRISIYARGSHTYLSADFGLTVKYDGLYEVSISVPSTYRGKTCGLCGNFNGNPNDEFHTPSGTTVTTPDEFGKAWKVEGDYTCSDGCGSSCPQCTNDLPARAQCEVIQAADGPFSICHKYVDPAPYFKSCVFDVCVAGPDALCADIETYVSACQSANVQISSWRQNTTCRLDCPANSHYELCGTDCGHTCASTNDATCEQGCSEGCFCDEGFLRSGTRCVPEGSCGCQYDGFYYNAGESFWTEGCSRHCECHAPNDLRCSAASCTSSQECTIQNGQLGCFDDMTTCTVWGDPHYITFDHKTYDFQGTCRYVLATLCGDTAGLHGFSVEAKNEPWKGLTVSVTAEVFVNVWGYQVHMSRGSHGVVQVNGETKNLPVVLNGTRISIYARGSHTYLSADFGLTVKYDGLYEVSISVPSTYRGKTCGLCGNFNGNPNDEFHTPSGTTVTTPDEFGKAWKVEGDYTCSDGCGSSCPQCTNDLPARAQCEVIQAADGPFSVCHKYVDPAPYFKSCVFDVCVAGPDALCADIETYVSACQSANVQISSWRQNTTCRLDCPANSHYELCGTDCGHTCASSNDATCEQGCSEGCFCDEGFLRSGTRCVPEGSCGCQYDGFYYNAGESFWTEGCSRHCECHAPNDLRCSAASCTSSQECTIQNGQLGCFDDMTTCTVWGDPHYITFDHKTYDFQGTCRYVLATLCGDTAGLHGFSVEAKNEPWKGLTVSVTAEVFVNVWGYQVHMSRGSHGVVQVNGETKNLPVVLNGTRISIYARGSHTYLSADFGLTVKYDGLYEVSISVPSTYRGKTCGLCGNFNGNPNDEFHTPSGTTVTTPDEFGKAWKVEGDYTCSDGCGSSCPQCTNELPARAQCEVIQAADGPFSVCHKYVDPAPYFKSCVFDVCVAGPDALCADIETYVSACQSANVQISSWRQNTTCRLDCPANSHYELCGTDCGHTCASTNDATCEQGCSEGCFCDEGFLRSGTRCVPEGSCGCQYDGFYYNAGESFWTEGCSRHCECHAPNDLRCSAASCTSSQECTIQNGQLGCFDDMTTCTVWGDPHYITFDHKTFDFQGTCRYVLATLCNDTAGLHGFSVEAKNEPWKGLTVSVTAEVFVNVWGYQVHMSRGSHGVVQVNGETKNLPVLLNGTRISIYARGSHTYLSADFGLTVKYDGLYEVSISVPSTYRGKTCGLCGNFNGNPNDEFHTPSGTIVTTPDEFGKAWKVEGDYTCSDGCGSSCPQCTNDLPARAQCEVIQAADGPFSICHKYVDPAPYFKSCVFDVCVAGPDALCADIETYVSACQSANVQISSWRQNTTCRLDCPANSHYELCGTDCGHTCASTNDATCEQGCSEGCFCDEGFLRSGTRCVPEGSCGCQYDGFYYNAGESFWTEGCSRHCECHAPNDLRCSAASCTSSQECTIQNGQLGCFDDMTTCTVWGDPHYITFDHKTYDFQGTCRYVLATLCGDTAGLHGFSVEAKNEPWKGLTVSVTAEVFVNVWGYQVHMSRGSHGVVQVNGETKNLPVVLNGTRISIYARGSHTYLSADFGLTVKYDGLYEVSISVPSTYRGKTCGLCGNFNGNPNDEFHTPSGTTVTTPDEFGKAWKVEGDYTCSDGCGSSCPQCTNDLPARAQCEVIQAADGPFSICHKYVDPAPYFKSCVFDVCVVGPDALCADIETYVSACQSANVQISSWRQNTTCRLDCPANSHYELCGTDCGHTCASTNDATCEQGCSEGCFCDEGFLRSGTRCVPEGSCGCQYDGFYYNAGESFWTEGCSRHCECHAPNDLRCSAASCTSSQECTIQNGQLGCFDDMTTCTVWGDPHYITFDHKTFDFQGTCRYVLATLCNDTAGLHGFSVEAKNEPWKGLTVSVTAEVFVNVWGYQVHMSRGSHGVVQVNGETKNLPVLLNGTRISIYATGSHTYLSADFGLTVKYDGLYEVSISVPSTYRGKTCGLCGNFNGNPNDEFHTPSGTIVTTPDEFGKAWKVEGDYTCSDGCGSSCPQCTNDLPARAQCEVIQAADGPFSICHKYVDPAPYFKSCVFDVCVAGPDALCADIETYVSACQSANVQISSWRQNTTCRLDCPANSHYELCGTDCGHTCASTNDATCEQGCSEGCFCDEGFLRSGTRCVPEGSCGCQYDGFYYNAGESFWTEGCSRHCECHAPNDLRCSAASCTSSQECTIQNGQLGCFDDMTTCTVWGDPHYITFDHKTYDFQGTCRYVLATLCGDTAGLHGFSVEAKNEPWKGLTVSVTAEVFVNVWGYQVLMSRGSHGVVQVNGETKNLPVVLNGTRISIYARGSHTYLSADFGLTVKYDGLYEVSISVPSTYRGKTCGLCGNFNGNPNDEFHTPSGTTVTTPDEFGKAWKVEGDYTCSDGCGSSCPQCTNELPARAQCEVIQAADGPFSVCHKYVDPAPYFKSCVFDVCVAGPDALCADIETYVSACQSANVQISSWRQNTTCRLDCPANSHYELCGTDCGHTCASTNDATCEQGCSEGCFCDEGFLRSGTRCVPEGSCGCQYDGFYYNAGESFWTEGCSRHCECHAPNDLRCSAASCTSSQECTIQNGQLGCFDDMTTCTVWGDPHYITFDHKTFDFQGTCRYVLATLCNDTAGLHGFSVEAKNEPWKGLTVSVTAEVFVNVWGYQVHMSRGSHGVVQVNGETKNLPVLLNGTRISIYARGSHTYLSADFGLTVKYDGLYEVSISVPSTYRGKTCGLCGNFNGNPNDEFHTPSGTIVTTPDEFGKAWKVEGDYTCSDGCGSSCPQCTNDLPARAQCEVIQAADGPFSICHKYVDPAPYFKSCVFDVCVAGPDALCADIETYVSACQSANVQISSWRQNTTCRLDCPANSHYELCGTDCGHTCASTNDATCEQGCSEGCFCDEGFLRSGTRCVPEGSCGCQYDGFYYNAGESFWTEGCSRHCECHAPNDLRCSAASCTSSQECTIQNGQLGCFDDMTTCTVWGDPHYITFDHKTYDFQGTCRYVLATLCGDTAGLHGFSVEAKNEPWKGLTVSVTAEVFVNVWGYQVHMSRGSHGVVQVNGETKNLPVVLNGTRISIYARGSHTYLSADFGLTVKYDGLYEVSISVPSTYRGKTCGLCGNFNGNPNDEFHTPSGTTVTTPDEFGKAWKVEGDYTCSDGCGSSCPQCTNDLPARAQCEVIQAADGPFSICHKYVDPAPYFKSCVFDVCVVGPDALCADIETYVSACQSANVQISSWRQNTTCRLDCPANSHYELCGTDCGHTCASTNDATCEQGCSEGCFCDEGFLRSGTRCVPEGSCGCQYDGFYYNAGESFWTEGCSRHCECHAPNDLRCSAASCTSSQECTIQNGQLGCFDDMTTCTVWGDPHYITFDHKTYDFQGTCRYVLATLCNDTAGLHGFSVEAKNVPWKGLTVSVTAEVFVNVWGYQVHMSRGSHGVVQVNGETKNLPVVLNGTRISIYARGSHTYLSADFGLTVKYDGLYEVSISVPSTYRGKTCGLCGNFNGNPNDEFHTPSGTIVTTPDEFGKAWKVEGDYTCSDGCGSSCPQCTNDLPARAQCEVIQAADGPFSICHKYVDPAPYFKSCVFDVCVAGPDALCADIETYVSACQSANVQISSWRQNTTCRLDCPANSHYELCGTDCGHTCASTNDATCEQGCSEGCFCDEGFLRSGTRCVPEGSCGCRYDGFYYNAGESFWTEGCSKQCECHAPNDLRCSAASCTSSQKCTIQNGQLGCYEAMSTCTVWGDPHYITFDGALAHFQGTCSYIITESVSHGTNETHFQVIATNNHRGNNHVSFVSAVDLYLKNHPEGAHVRIAPNKRVKVNGNDVSLPIIIGTIAQVERQGSYIIVNAIDLIVQFDGQSTLLVRVGQHRQNRVRGMCGNFNSDPADDKVLPNGTLAQNDNHFGHSWKSPTSQPGCGSTDEDGGDGLNDCPFKQEYSELCSVITNSSGPFSACHLHSDPQPFFTSCVYDLCQYTPANGMLCSAVSAYEKTCSVLGLNIPEWRPALQCAESDPCEQLDCTEYEWCGEQDGVYGCFCDEHHHRPNNESYDSSITCVSSSGTIAVSRCQLFEAGFHPSDLHLRDDSCKGTLQHGRLVFHFNNDDQLCGTLLRSNGTHFMYENTIQGDVDPHQAIISREKSIHLHFSCEYPLAQAVSMDVGINPLESIVSRRLPLGLGHYYLRMILYEDTGFRFPLTRNRNLEVEIDQKLYIEVQTEGVDEQQISTILDSCWATPFDDASYPVRWDLITAQCPNPEDETVELIQNGISTVARFSFRMFTFTNFSSIYLHCQVHLCLLRHNNCTAHCYPGYHTRVVRDVSHHDTAAISVGPLILRKAADERMKTSSASGQLTSVMTLLISLLAVKTLT